MPGQSSKLSRGGFDASTLLEEAREEVDSLRCNQLFHSRTPGADWFFPSRVCLQLKYVEQASNIAPLFLKHVRDIPWFIFVFQSIFRIFGSFGSPKNCSRCKFPSIGPLIGDVRDFWTASASSSTAWAAHGTQSSRNFASWKIPRRSCRRSDDPMVFFAWSYLELLEL